MIKILIFLFTVFLPTTFLSAEQHYPEYFHGAIVPLVTPYQLEEGHPIDLTAFRELVEFACQTNLSAIFSVSGIGQWDKLSIQEKKELISASVEIAAKRKPILAGVGSTKNTNEVVELAKYAEQAGVEALVVITPSFIREMQPEINGRRLILDQELIYDYFQTVCSQINCDIVLYDRWVEIKPATLSKLLSNFPNIKAIKITEDKDLEHFSKMSQAAAGRCAILAGFETIAVGAFQHGAVGLLAGGANVYPDLLAELVDHCLSNNWDAAAQLQEQVCLSWQMICTMNHWGPAIKKVLNEVIGINMHEVDRGEVFVEGSSDLALEYFQRDRYTSKFCH